MAMSAIKAVRAVIELRNRHKRRLTMPPEVVIPGDMSFTDWCIRLGEDGMLVDGLPFRLDDRLAMQIGRASCRERV